jgi:hypothetical protein
MDIIAAAATALQADSSISSWLTTNYAATLKVFVGEDINNQPGETEAPCVILAPSTCDFSDNGYRTYTFDCDWLLVNSTVDTATAGRETLTGLTHADDFGHLIFDCIRTRFNTSVVSSANYMVEPTPRFPLCQGGMTITIEIPKPLGHEPTL